VSPRTFNIVCLGWGSLVWHPGELPVAGDWKVGGPALPIEFARVGDGGELATVITPGHPDSVVRWAELDESDLANARALLRRREAIVDEKDVGFVVVGEPVGTHPYAAAILHWASARGIDAVVWTALPPRFEGAPGRVPDPQEAVDYLRSLSGHVRRHAEDYVRQVPAEIRTRNRRALQEAIES
jgi:hypothetical protein